MTNITNISIIIPCFNRKKFIQETLESILNQSNPNWEALIVDDGSTDGSIELVSEIVQKDERIRLMQRNRLPKGAPTCRNIGVDAARSEFIAFLDSDDLIAPYYVEQRLRAVSESPGFDFYVFSMLLFKERIDDLRTLTNISTEEEDFYRFLRSDIVWTISCPLWRKESFLKIGGFDESFPNCQDHDLHLRALYHRLKYKKLMDLPPDNFYRQHNDEKIYDPKDNKRILVGVEKLIFKTAGYFNEDNNGFSANLFKKNLGVTLVFALRRYFSSGYLKEAEMLLKNADNENLVARFIYCILNIYLALYSIRKVKGFERVWSLILKKHKWNNNWGKYKYQGELGK